MLATSVFFNLLSQLRQWLCPKILTWCLMGKPSLCCFFGWVLYLTYINKPKISYKPKGSLWRTLRAGVTTENRFN